MRYKLYLKNKIVDEGPKRSLLIPRGRGKLNPFWQSVTDYKRVRNHFQGGNSSGLSLIYCLDDSEAVKVDVACTH